ncbi:MICAL-like [Carabus blaptoides fortunei]
MTHHLQRLLHGLENVLPKFRTGIIPISVSLLVTFPDEPLIEGFVKSYTLEIGSSVFIHPRLMIINYQNYYSTKLHANNSRRQFYLNPSAHQFLTAVIVDGIFEDGSSNSFQDEYPLALHNISVTCVDADPCSQIIISTQLVDLSEVNRTQHTNMSERRGTKALETWCRRMSDGYPGVKVDNMTTSWRDGLAFCAIIHHFRPDLIDFAKLNKDDIYYNNNLAFRVAECHLGIPALLDAEDMVEYEVPDRLSILTYLSQFYQAFVGTQGSPTRIVAKRPAVTTDRGIVSPTSTSPPTKMAVRSGIATPGSGVMGRREPCAKCGYPVFLAERLNVGTKLYHRTCFRCARCNTQLSLANCYETETDGQYCCETCPDEEESTRKLTKLDSSDTLKSSVKLDADTSITDGMNEVKDPFDTKRQRLDQMRNRSLSDEEKRKGLQQFEDDEYSSHFEIALEESNYHDDSLLSKARNTFLSSHLLEEEIKPDSDIPPPLPETEPPDSSTTSLTINRLSATVSTSPAVEPNVNSVEPSATISVDAKFDASVVDVNSTDKISDKSDQPVTASDATLEDTTIIREKHSTKDTNRSSLVKSRMLMFETGDAVQPKLTSPSSYNKDKVSAVSKYFSSNKDNQKTASTSTDGKRRLPLVDSPNGSAKTDISQEIISTNVQTDEPSLPITIRDLEVGDTNLEMTDDTSIDRPITLTVDNVCDQIEPKVETPESPEDAADSVEDNSDVNKSVSQDPISSIDSIDIKISEDTFEKPHESIEDMPVEEAHANIDLTSEITKADEPILVVDETRCASLSSEDALEESNANYKTVRSELLSDSLVVESSVSVESTPISKAPLKLDPMMKKILTQSILEDLSLDQSPVTLDPSILDSTAASKSDTDYPEDLNPFGDEDEDTEDVQDRRLIKPSTEDLTLLTPSPVPRKNKTKSAVRKSTNPFGSSDEDEEETVVKSKPPRPPMPAVRSNDDSGQKKLLDAPKVNLNPFWTSEDEPSDEETNAKPVPMPRSSKTLGTPEPRPRRSGMSNNAERYDSNSSLSSLNSSISHTPGRKKKPAPPPPATLGQKGVGSSPLGSKQTSPNTSTQPSPKLTPRVRKSRKAPLPPSSTPFVAKRVSESTDISPLVNHGDSQISPIVNHGESQISPDEPKVVNVNQTGETIYFSPMDSLPSIDTETEKINKDEKNRNRQSQSLTSPISDSDSLSLSQSPAMDKSTHGKWKRKKGPAPARPAPQRRQIKPLPLTELRRELDIIEMQQQGLEKQGVKLEQLIREKCETPEATDDTALSPEVEDLVLELFELVNEKNELFRRQAELMYLRRDQRLAEEHADLEYQIRCLMHRPEKNITDSDKTREEELLNRLVQVVERRNEIVECLEMDRVREAEEDQSINSRLSLIAAKRDEENQHLESPVKLSKKEKKKMKKEKKLKEKGKTLDIDKDIDESESHNNTVTGGAAKEKKKKKWF